jgi:hypothetical protein
MPGVFEGINFNAGDRAISNVRYSWMELSYEFPIWYDRFPPHNSFLNAVGAIKGISGNFTMGDAFGHTGTHAKFAMPLPEVGFHGRVRIQGETDFEFRAVGLRTGFVDSAASNLDLEAGINQKFFDRFTVTGKYRYSNFRNRDADDNRFQIRFLGPEVDANVHF